MLSKIHKTTSECQQRTSGTQKTSPLSSKGGRKNIKDPLLWIGKSQRIVSLLDDVNVFALRIINHYKIMLVTGNSHRAQRTFQSPVLRDPTKLQPGFYLFCAVSHRWPQPSTQHVSSRKHNATKLRGFPGGAGGEEPACQGQRHKRCGREPGRLPSIGSQREGHNWVT